VWGAPILYVVENNQIAQTTPTVQAMAGDMALRFAAFDIFAVELDTSDVLEISAAAKDLLDDIRSQGTPRSAAAKDLLDDIRSQGTPRGLILHTQRFGPHSKGDDTRDPKVVEHLRDTRDPLKILAARLSPEEQASIESEIKDQVGSAFQQALNDPDPMM